MNLRPAMLDDLGLVPALLWHISRFSSQTGVQVRLRHTGFDRRLPTDVETAAFRIVQEALTNVARHAGARQATVGLRSDGKTISLRVEDDGKGFSLRSIALRESSGLAGMQERARLIGGALKIRSGPGKGTRILARLPAGTLPEGEPVS
jgi:signal transduction histidine kinase